MSLRARLVAAVSDAGGFGTLGAATMTTEELSSEMQQVRDLTAAPFGVNALPCTVNVQLP